MAKRYNVELTDDQRAALEEHEAGSLTRRQRYRVAIAGSGLRERVFRGLTPTLPYPEQTSVLTRP